jgi:ATP synthase mitochondrial F1 complex assembly factor 2
MLSQFLFVEKQKVKIDPILDWVNTEFGFKPVVYTTFFGGKQEEGLTKAVQGVLMKTTDCELASIDAMAAAAHSLVIPLAIFRGRLGIEEAIELIRLEEDHQVCILQPLLFSSAASNLLPMHLPYAC